MDDKTQTKSRGLPSHLSPGNPGNSGGKKGRSGRKSNAFLERCIANTEDPALWKLARKRQPFSVLQLSAEHAYGKPRQAIEHSGPDGEPIDIRVADLRARLISRIAGMSTRIPAAQDHSEPHTNGTRSP